MSRASPMTNELLYLYYSYKGRCLRRPHHPKLPQTSNFPIVLVTTQLAYKPYVIFIPSAKRRVCIHNSRNPTNRQRNN